MRNIIAIFIAVVVFLPHTSHAQEMSGRRKAAPNYRTIHGVLPLVSLSEQTVGKVEFNLGAKASLAIEGVYSRTMERYSEKEVKTTGNSLIAQGRGLSIIVARFSRPYTMSGFYWGLGIGYREMTADWRVFAEADDPNIDFALTDRMGYLDHNAKLSGMTGHGRFGWRYAPDWPFMVGVYIGARHFQSRVEDIKDKAGNPTAAPLTEVEKTRLRRYFMSKLEPGLELALSF